MVGGWWWWWWWGMMVVVWCAVPRSIGHTAKRASVDGFGVTTDRLVAPAAMVGTTRAVEAAAASSAVVVVAVVMVMVWCVLPRSIGHTAKRAGVYDSGATADRRARQAGSVGLRIAPSATVRRRRHGRGVSVGGSANHEAEKARTFAIVWLAAAPLLRRELQPRHRRVANPRLGG